MRGERHGVIRRELFPGPFFVMKRARRAKFLTAEEYQRYARQCLEVAPAFRDEEARATLLGIARAWLRLAYLAQANGHIVELKVRIVRQRVIVKYALDTGQRSEMAESLLDALEGSLRLFEKHRIFLLSCSAGRLQTFTPPSSALPGSSNRKQRGAKERSPSLVVGKSRPRRPLRIAVFS